MVVGDARESIPAVGWRHEECFWSLFCLTVWFESPRPHTRRRPRSSEGGGSFERTVFRFKHFQLQLVRITIKKGTVETLHNLIEVPVSKVTLFDMFGIQLPVARPRFSLLSILYAGLVGVEWEL